MPFLLGLAFFEWQLVRLVKMNSSNVAPSLFSEAVVKGWSLLNESEKDVLRKLPIQKAGIELHLTLGHRLRTELGLWGSDTSQLFDDMNAQLPEHLAVDADTASAALIDVLWHEVRKRT